VFNLARHIDNHYSIIVFEQTARELQASAPVSALAINDLAPVAHLDEISKISPSLPRAIVQTNLGFTESEQSPSVNCLHHAFLAFAYDE